MQKKSEIQLKCRKKVKIQQSKDYLGIDLLPNEMAKLYKVVNQFIRYKNNTLPYINRQITSISTLKKQLLMQFPQLISRSDNMKLCVQKNYQFLKNVIGITAFEHFQENEQYRYDFNDIQKLLFEVTRQWSHQSVTQRGYIQKLKQLNKKWNKTGAQKILIPGTKTGRILYQFYKDGYEVQGNQQAFDFFLVSNYIINSCIDTCQIYPNVLNFCNHIHQKDPYRKILIPDIIPKFKASQQNESQITISLGDFCNIYSHQGNSWNTIITAFYLHRKKNIIQVISRIRSCLKKQGIWINYGHLIYQNSLIQLSYLQIKQIMKKQKLEVLQQGEQWHKYYQNDNNLMNSQYLCQYFVVRKLYD